MVEETKGTDAGGFTSEGAGILENLFSVMHQNQIMQEAAFQAAEEVLGSTGLVKEVDDAMHEKYHDPEDIEPSDEEWIARCKAEWVAAIKRKIASIAALESLPVEPPCTTSQTVS